MGNALCFPIESLMFWAIALGSILAQSVYDKTYRSVREVCLILERSPNTIAKRFPLYVFGDDIIIPDSYFIGVCESLELSGLKVNTNKSCFSCTTPIKESCGSYWWGDDDVRIIKFPYTRIKSTLHFHSLKDQILDERLSDYFNLAEGMFHVLTSVHPVYNFTRESLLSGLKDGWIRFNPDFQRLEVREPRLVTDDEWSSLPGDVGLYAFFTSQATHPLSQGDAQHVIWEWSPLCT